jgi:hypothetical protein
MKTYTDYPNLINEIEAIDVIFRVNFTVEELTAKVPYTSTGRKEHWEEESIDWNKLFGNEITEEHALEEIVKLMMKYYNRDVFDTFKYYIVNFKRRKNVEERCVIKYLNRVFQNNLRLPGFPANYYFKNNEWRF